MREVKFRAFLKGKKKMLPVTYLTLSDEESEQVGVADCNNEGCVLCDDYEKVELMQFTGLKDKNGREIYEGDIIAYLDSYDRSSESGYNFEEFMNKGEIVFNDEYGRFDVTNRSDINYFDFCECVNEYEVIGNIYENPELLEVNK